MQSEDKLINKTMMLCRNDLSGLLRKNRSTFWEIDDRLVLWKLKFSDVETNKDLFSLGLVWYI